MSVGISKLLSQSNNRSLGTVSKALRKSTKQQYSFFLRAFVWSIKHLSVKMWSIVEKARLKPAWGLQEREQKWSFCMAIFSDGYPRFHLPIALKVSHFFWSRTFSCCGRTSMKEREKISFSDASDEVPWVFMVKHFRVFPQFSHSFHIFPHFLRYWAVPIWIFYLASTLYNM